ncbi:CAP domain-containing protein [Streptomyces sp. NPDC047014]|uniref:CAP domain-containing protein n=1 Tax=Streptomyces sp. NPDC047014 TaxID=3155736 RepID=UPI0033CF2517
MQKHRKKKQYRKIVIAVSALGIVGVPTAAMACFDSGDGGRTPTASRQEHNPWRYANQAAPATPPAAEAPLPSAPPAGPAGPAEAAPGDPAAPAQPVVQTSEAPAQEPAQQPAPQPQPARKPAKPPVATKKPQASAPAPAPVKPSAAPATGAAAEVLALVNQERAAAGCPAVTLNAKLTQAAQDHSADMASHSNMSHTGSDGSDPGQRITRAGYTWSTYGENVAYGYGSPKAVMDGWMNSPGHRQNILNCSFKEIGIGLAQPNNYWTQAFGASR